MSQQKYTSGLPQSSGEYKVVQVEIDGKSEIYFGDLHAMLHCTILAQTLERYAIPVRYIKIEDDVEVAATEGERYRVIGMGKAVVDVGRKFVQFYGNSYHYGIGLDRGRLEQTMEEYGEWSCMIA